MFEAIDIERNLKDVIDPTIWRRGVQYHKQNAVGKCMFSAYDQKFIEVSAKIRGTQMYKTSITFDTEGGEVCDASCDCPYAEDGNLYCKHIVALGCELLARIRKTFGDSIIETSANTIAEALQTRHLRQETSINSVKHPVGTVDKYESVRARLSSMWLDMSLVTNKLLAELAPILPQNTPSVSPTTIHLGIIPKTTCLFGTRYASVVEIGAGGAKIRLHDKEQQNIYMCTPALSNEVMRGILTDASIEMTDSERAFVEYISKHDQWSASFDIYQAFALVRDASILMYRDSYGEKNRMQIIGLETPIPIAIELRRETWETNAREGQPKTRSSFELLMQRVVANSNALSVGKNGFVHIRKREIALYKASNNVCALMKRMKQGGSYYGRIDGLITTRLTDDETIHLNDIITELQKCFALTTTLTPDFIITKYDKSEQALLINYNSAESKLSIRGAVDYGCETLDVSEIWNAQNWHARTLHPTRNINAKQHPLIVSINDKKIEYAKVDAKKEENVYRTLYEKYGFNKRVILTLNGTKKIEQFLRDNWESIIALGWKMIFTRDEIKYATSEVRTDMNVDLNAEKDWLAFDLVLYCGDERVRLEDVIAYIERGDECLKTEDGRLIRVTNRADLERLVRMLERFSQSAKTGKFEGRLYNAPEVADVASNSPHYRAQFAKSFDTFMTEARSGKPVRKVTLPKSHRDLLRPYQTTGVEWMHFLRRYRFGGILADEMGLGKTIQALSHLDVHAKDGESSLVVCPKTLLHNWKRETQTRFQQLSVAVVEGTANERKNIILQKSTKKNIVPNLLITSYPLAQRDLEWYKARKKPFHYLLLDEAQSIKNPRTKNAHAVKAIPAEYRVALTGTPLENSVEELWSVFDFLMPGFLGTHASFQKHFGKPIMEHGHKGALAHLKSKTSCFMLRRTKADVLKELPPKIEQVMQVELNDDQNVLYQEVLARTRTELFAEVEKRGFKRAQIHILAALTKLRQICNHPSLVEPKGEYSSAKLDACMNIVREIKSEGRKVLIFSQFTSMLDIIADSLREEKIAFSLLTGKTSKRQELVDAFNTDSPITAFLISLKAGGVGLNLTSADTVIIFDPWWNPATENQAVDRTHRIGQNKTVNVYRLITKGTIEEKIIALQSKKRALFDALVQENTDLFKKLTWDDVQGLFR